MDEFFQYLASLHRLSDELKAALIGRIHRDTYRKNRLLLKAGEQCDWLGFIERGLVKVCYDGPGGRERIVCFLRAGEMLGFVRSYSPGIPSRLSIISLDETIVRKLPLREAEAIADKHPVFHVHLRKITEQQAALIQEHYLLITEPARERLAKVPTLFAWMLKDRRIKQYMIADYLGVDRATMSRWKWR